MRKTMLNFLQDTLQDGMNIENCKEYSSKYKLVISYNGMSLSCELLKACSPGSEVVICKQAINTALCSMYININELEMASKWLHGEMWNKSFKKSCKECKFPCYKSGCGLKPITYDELKEMGYIICEDYEV